MHPSATNYKQSFCRGSLSNSFLFRFGRCGFLLWRCLFLGRCRRRTGFCAGVICSAMTRSLANSRRWRMCGFLRSCRFTVDPGNGREFYRLCNRERTSRLHRIRRQVIPSSQLLNRDSKPIGNCNQRIAPAHSVPLRSQSRRGTGNRDHKFVVGIHALICRKFVDLRDVACMRM